MKATLRSAQSKSHSLAPLLIDSWSPDWRWPLGLPEISQFVLPHYIKFKLEHLNPAKLFRNCVWSEHSDIFLVAILFVVSFKAISFVSHKSEFQMGNDFWGFIFWLIYHWASWSFFVLAVDFYSTSCYAGFLFLLANSVTAKPRGMTGREGPSQNCWAPAANFSALWSGWSGLVRSKMKVIVWGTPH